MQINKLIEDLQSYQKQGFSEVQFDDEYVHGHQVELGITQVFNDNNELAFITDDGAVL